MTAATGPVRAQRPLVVVGGFKHELNSFALGITTLDDIRQAGYYAEGPDIFDAPRTKRPELAAIREIAEREGIELVPTVHFHALFAGGPIEHAHLRARQGAHRRGGRAHTATG